MSSDAAVTVAPEVADRIRIGLVRAEPVEVGPSGAALLGEIDATSAALTRRHAGKTPAEIPGLAPARELYRAFGIDPTRTRPSSEALLRRVLHGKPLPRISNAVDLCNLLSLTFLLPLGLYDAGALRGAVTLRCGAPGETYAGIRKGDVRVEGRPVLADREGPFGNPTSDSLRASVHEGTRSLWLVVFAPLSLSIDTLAAHVETARAAMALHLAPEDEEVDARCAVLQGPAGGGAGEGSSTP